MEQPDWMEYLGRRERLRIEDLKIEQGDKSRLLDEEELGKAWAVNSPDNSRDVLLWAKRDEVVRQIMDSRSPSPNPLNRCVKLLSPPSSDIAMSETATTPSITYDNPVHVLDEHAGQELPSKNNAPNPQNHRSSAQQSLHQQIKAKGIRRSRLTRASGSGNSIATNAKIRKSAQKPTMGTRFCNLTKLYQLDLSGVVIT